MPEASLTDVMHSFGFTKENNKGETVADPAAFRKEWGDLTELDKSDIRTGIGDGSLTY